MEDISKNIKRLHIWEYFTGQQKYINIHEQIYLNS